MDPTSNLADDKVFLFSGTLDSVVNPKTMSALNDYYLTYVKPQNIVTDFNFAAQHCMPTLNYGEKCTQLASPYIGNCNLDGAEMALKQIYGSLVPGVEVSSNLRTFDQTSYFTGTTSSTSIGTTGYIYTPTKCSELEPCSLHVVFHGCSQTLNDIGNAYAVHTGYNSWAEANNIVVLYPYVTNNQKLGNPNGCWDWWGYAGTDYSYKSGVQMSFAMNVINAVSN